MPGEKHTTEQIIRKLRQAEVEIAQGSCPSQKCESLACADANRLRDTWVAGPAAAGSGDVALQDEPGEGSSLSMPNDRRLRGQVEPGGGRDRRDGDYRSDQAAARHSYR